MRILFFATIAAIFLLLPDAAPAVDTPMGVTQRRQAQTMPPRPKRPWVRGTPEAIARSYSHLLPTKKVKEERDKALAAAKAPAKEAAKPKPPPGGIGNVGNNAGNMGGGIGQVGAPAAPATTAK